MYLAGFNSNNNYAPVEIPVISGIVSEVASVSTTEYEVENFKFRKVTDSATELSINFRSTVHLTSIELLTGILEVLGIHTRGGDTAYRSEDLTSVSTLTLSQFHASLSPYYYQFKHTNDANTTYQISIANVSYTAGTYGSYEYSACYPFVCIGGDNKYYYGFIAWRVDGSSDATIGRISLSKAISSDDYIYPDAASGETGFKPTGAYTTKDRPGNGGRGTANKKNPEYSADAISQPGAPDESVASAIGSGFINCYKIDTANLKKVGQCLYGSNMLGFLQSLAVNPLDFIISLMVFPCSPSVGSAENIKLGGWLAQAAGGAALGFDATGYRLANEFKVVDFGTLTIPENWGNFLDFSQTTIELYLPFIGSVNIDTSEVMGGTINIQYTIDFFTGMCVANVLCTRPNMVLPSGKALSYVHAQHAYQGNCAIQIPLSAINYGSMVGSLINACTQGITNPVAGFAGVATDAVGGGFRPNVTSKGNIVANAGFCSVLYPYVRITRPITAEPESYQEVMGLPSYINTTLGECEDLCICDEIDLKGITGATESELNKIRQMCKDGVYV